MAPSGSADPGGPIFVVGSLGSGSTLLRLMLDSHVDIAIPPETGFMRAVLANEWIPFWLFGGEWYGRLGLTADELRARLAGFYGSLFGEYASRRGKRRWGDKTPFHVWHLEEMMRLFPDASVVGIVRHPGGVASSLHERFGYEWGRAFRHWVRVNRRLVHGAGLVGERFRLCRYEELLLRPEPVLRELLVWLGEPWDERVLRHHDVQPASGAPGRVEGHTRPDRPLDTDRVGAWVAGLPDHAAALLRQPDVEAVARYFGYRVDDPTVLERLGATDGTVLASGVELSARCAEFRDVDWAHPPQPSLENALLKPELLTTLRGGSVSGRGRLPGTERVVRRLAGRLPPGAQHPIRRLARRFVRR
jgi:Sulfotransferase family